jgi:hypothetical protein
MEREQEVVAVLDRESLVALRRVVGSSFGVGVRSRVSARWCAVNGVRAVQRGDVLNAVWPPSREDMDQVRLVLGKRRSRLTNDDKLLLCRRRDMITFKYDPLLAVSSIAIVFTRMTIGEDKDTSNFLRSIRHNNWLLCYLTLLVARLLRLKLGICSIITIVCTNSVHKQATLLPPIIP